MARPDLTRVPVWYHSYIKQVKEEDLMEAFSNQARSFIPFLRDLPEAKRQFRYAEGKWTIQEMLQHIIDAERVFAYRALCIARKETASLPSFDENSYAENSKAASRDWEEMLKEFTLIRQSNEILFKSFDKEQLESTGIASGKSVYVLALGYIIVGHVAHHQRIIQERYIA